MDGDPYQFDANLAVGDQPPPQTRGTLNPYGFVGRGNPYWRGSLAPNSQTTMEFAPGALYQRMLPFLRQNPTPLSMGLGAAGLAGAGISDEAQGVAAGQVNPHGYMPPNVTQNLAAPVGPLAANASMPASAPMPARPISAPSALPFESGFPFPSAPSASLANAPLPPPPRPSLTNAPLPPPRPKGKIDPKKVDLGMNQRFTPIQYQVPSGRGPLGNNPIYTALNLGGGQS